QRLQLGRAIVAGYCSGLRQCWHIEVRISPPGIQNDVLEIPIANNSAYGLCEIVGLPFNRSKNSRRLRPCPVGSSTIPEESLKLYETVWLLTLTPLLVLG